MYATPGFQPYILPFGVLHDQTNRGPLWDPALNTLSYTYNYTSDILLPSTRNPTAVTEWFYFNGHWGDKFYPLSDARQYEFVGEYHYVSGPLGPRFKHLGRRRVCQGRYTDPCVIRDWLPRERSLDDVRDLERLWERDHVTGVEIHPRSRALFLLRRSITSAAPSNGGSPPPIPRPVPANRPVAQYWRVGPAPFYAVLPFHSACIFCTF
ncbi:MAG: hypothetical protein Q9210_006726 [Variospora velana]